MILIGNKYHGDKGEYVGRGSPLGNPYKITEKQGRDFVCDQYEEYLHKEIRSNNLKIINELNRLKRILDNNNKLTLICFCHPKRCHARTIRSVLTEWECK